MADKGRIKQIIQKNTDIRVYPMSVTEAIYDLRDGKSVREQIDELKNRKSTVDYADLENKPSINGVTLNGSMSNANLGIPTSLAELTDDATHRVVTDTEKAKWDKGSEGKDGKDGKSAYQIALDNGYKGTESQWLASLKGAKGDQGDKGTDGTDGTNGTDGVDGANGLSAYEIAVNDGFSGDEEDWLSSLHGIDGRDGSDGIDGDDGLSAYQIALDNGYKGTEDEWLESLKQPAIDAAEETLAIGGIIVSTDEPTDNRTKVWMTPEDNPIFNIQEQIEDIDERLGDLNPYSDKTVAEYIDLCKTATELSDAQNTQFAEAESVRQEQEAYREVKQADMEVAIRNKQDLFVAGKGLYFTPASESLESKYIINTYYGNATIGAVISLTPSSTTVASDMGTYLIQVNQGDKFRLSGTGGNNWRLWAWLDVNRKIVSNSAGNLVATDLELVAGQDGYLTVNARPSAFHSLVKITDSNEEILRVEDSIIVSQSNQEAIQDDLMVLAMHPTDVAEWSSKTSLENLFSYSNSASQWQQKRLWTIAPSIYTDNEVTTMISTFYGQSSITSIDLSNINLSKCTSYYYAFNKCTALAEIKGALCSDRNKKVDAWGMCDNCNRLTYINVGEMTPSRFTTTFRSCSSLVRVDGVMYLTDGVMLSGANLNSCTSMRYLKLNSIGIDSTELSVNLNMPCWGVNSEDVTDAYDSLVYSLVDNIYDRASNGLATCTISLSTTTKGLLSDAQKASIVAKGFTIA